MRERRPARCDLYASRGPPSALLFVQQHKIILGLPTPLLELFTVSEHIKDFVAGGVAEAVARIALHPIETMKVRKQMSCSLHTSVGLKSMYQGLGEALVGAVPSTAGFAMLYNMLKNQVVPCFSEALEGPVSVACATVATTLACLAEEPLEVIKQRLQSGVSRSFGEAVRDVTSKQGLVGLYSSFRSTLVRDLPFDALEFAVYEQLRKAYKHSKGKLDVDDREMVFLGMATGAIVGFATLPMDVVRTRIITQPMKYNGVRRTVRILFAEEGFGVFFKGVRHRVSKESIESGLFFLVYENVERLFRKN